MFLFILYRVLEFFMEILSARYSYCELFSFYTKVILKYPHFSTDFVILRMVCVFCFVFIVIVISAMMNDFRLVNLEDFIFGIVSNSGPPAG